jgi:hypothetical protein
MITRQPAFRAATAGAAREKSQNRTGVAQHGRNPAFIIDLRPPMVSGNISGNSGMKMTGKAKSPVAKHRARMERRGLVRVEIKVHKEDVSLLRCVATALSDPARRGEARLLLRQRFVEPPKVSLKALLAAAPLDGIELDRSRDLGRDIEL